MTTTKQLIDDLKILKADFDAAYELLVKRTQDLEEHLEKVKRLMEKFDGNLPDITDP